MDRIKKSRWVWGDESAATRKLRGQTQERDPRRICGFRIHRETQEILVAGFRGKRINNESRERRG